MSELGNPLITRLYSTGPLGPRKKLPLDKLYEIYNEGGITWNELRSFAVEWSTDASGRKFYYVCPTCHAPMRHCPDPACAEEGVGHHLLEEKWNDECVINIPYKAALKYYEPIGSEIGMGKSWCVDMNTMEKIKKELNAAIQGVLAKYDSRDYGCEFHGELIGLLQHKDVPETATGWHFKVGMGLPETWYGPLPGSRRCQDQDLDKGSSTETCSPDLPQEKNLPNAEESTAGI